MPELGGLRQLREFLDLGPLGLLEDFEQYGTGSQVPPAFRASALNMLLGMVDQILELFQHNIVLIGRFNVCGHRSTSPSSLIDESAV
jgi:hypothetical protein